MAKYTLKILRCKNIHWKKKNSEEKLRGKTSIAEFNFIKVVGQKSDAVINMELFLNVLYEIKGLTAWSQTKLKNKSLWSIFVRLWLKFPEESGRKIKRYFIGENFVGEKWRIFLEIPSLFPVENFPRRKFYPMKIFPDEKLYLPNTFFQEQTTF